jgi:crotonobetainyl-CoA:carnitine CoA-transferase CaiB-like acyl-CoA transferase
VRDAAKVKRVDPPAENRAPLPLTGVRVVEFVHMVMGPVCGLILADLGAEVIKVEPVGGDNTRRLTGSGAGFFVTFNRNKKSLALDMSSPAGRALVERLLATADVVTENFRSGAMRRLGLDYERVRALRPEIVYCSLKGFLPGPYARRTALDEVVQMMGGLAYMTGPPGRPLRAGASVNDIMGGMFGVIAILSALRERDATGRGQQVGSALFESNVLLVAQHMAQYAVSGVPAPPMPERLSAWAIYDVFRTRDGEQVFVGVVTDSQWRRFCEYFEQPALYADPSLASNNLRVAARDRLLPRVREVFGARTRAELMQACEAIDLPFAPITRPHELFEDPHLNAAGGLLEVTDPGAGPVRVPALPLELDGRRLGLRLDAPRVGEHTGALLGELGLDECEVAALAADGVIALDPYRRA